MATKKTRAQLIKEAQAALGNVDPEAAKKVLDSLPKLDDTADAIAMVLGKKPKKKSD